MRRQVFCAARRRSAPQAVDMPDNELCRTPATALDVAAPSADVVTRSRRHRRPYRASATPPRTLMSTSIVRRYCRRRDTAAGRHRGRCAWCPRPDQGLTTMVTAVRLLAAPLGVTVVEDSRYGGHLAEAGQWAVPGKDQRARIRWPWRYRQSPLYVSPMHPWWKTRLATSGRDPGGAAAASRASGLGPLAEGADGAGLVRWLPARPWGGGAKWPPGRIPPPRLIAALHLRLLIAHRCRCADNGDGWSVDLTNSAPADGIDHAAANAGDITVRRAGRSP